MEGKLDEESIYTDQGGVSNPSKVLKTSTKRANWHEMLGPKQGKEDIYAG